MMLIIMHRSSDGNVKKSKEFMKEWNKLERPNGTNSAKIIHVIKTTAKRGAGTEKDPVREVTQYWDFEGNFLAEKDPEHCIPLIEYECKAVKESIS